jgi:hypothetical protein
MQHLLHQNLRPPTLPPHTGTLIQISLELRSLGRNRRHYSILGRGHLQSLLHLRSSLGVLDVFRFDVGCSLALRRRAVDELQHGYHLGRVGLLCDCVAARDSREY